LQAEGLDNERGIGAGKVDAGDGKEIEREWEMMEGVKATQREGLSF
jgi:hypothetical protein